MTVSLFLPSTSCSRTDISARVWQTAAVPIPDSTITVLPFNDERWDTDNIHDTVTGNTRLTAKTTGKYVICGHVRFDGNATGLRQVGIYKNGNTIAVDSKPAVSSGGVPGWEPLDGGFERDSRSRFRRTLS